MPAHRLSRLFDPQSIALVGASERPGSVGATLWRMLSEGSYFTSLRAQIEGLDPRRYAGRIYPVNPKHRSLGIQRCYATLRDIPEAVDLVVVATPLEAVAQVLEDAAARGCRYLIIFSRSPRRPEDGRELAQKARALGLRIVGPGARGLVRPAAALDLSAQANQTDAPILLESGSTGVISQSGAWLAVLRDFALGSSIRFSSLLATGEAADLDVGELLDFFAFDPETREVLVYAESIRNAQAFMSSVRQLARMKPVVIMKAGNVSAPLAAGETHAQILLHQDRVVDAAIRRAGAVRAYTGTHVVGTARLLAGLGKRIYRRVAIVSNGRGPGLVAVDALQACSLSLASLSPDTFKRLRQDLPGYARIDNPVDLAGDATALRYEVSIRTLLDDPGVDCVLVLYAPQAMLPAEALATALARVAGDTDKAILAVLGGQARVREARSLLDAARVAQFMTVENAVEALATMQHFSTHQAILREVPSEFMETHRPDEVAAQAIIERAWSDGRNRLYAHEARALLAAYGISVLESSMAVRPSHAVTAAEAIGYPVVLKVVSPDVVQKSELGAVQLDLKGPTEVRRAFRRIHDNMVRHAPEARVVGVTVQPFVRRFGQRELYLGLAQDPVFGTVLGFGAGGVAVERIDDIAVELPPINSVLASRWIERTRVARLLEEHADIPEASREALIRLLLRFSALACACPEILACDLNPVMLDADEALVVDARIVLHPRAEGLRRRAGARYQHLAIHPYPRELEQEWQLMNGEQVFIRPIRPEDDQLERDFVAALAPETRYFRFMMNVRELTPAMIERFTQIDYRRELALIALERPQVGVPERICAVARITPSGQEDECEFAIVVGQWRQGGGLGARLMRALFEAARQRGYRTMYGSVLADNPRMLAFCESLGFSVQTDPDDESLRIARLDLLTSPS